MISEKSFEPYKYQTKPGQDQITAETIVSGQFWAYSQVNIKKYILKLNSIMTSEKAIELNTNTNMVKSLLNTSNRHTVFLNRGSGEYFMSKS